MGEKQDSVTLLLVGSHYPERRITVTLGVPSPCMSIVGLGHVVTLASLTSYHFIVTCFCF